LIIPFLKPQLTLSKYTTLTSKIKIMKTIYQSKNLIVKYDEENSILENSWFDSHMMSAEEYKNELIKHTDFAVEYRPTNFLVNSPDFAFSVDPEIQEWIIKHIFPRSMHPSSKKMAIIVSKDIFAHVSIEQTIDDASDALGKINTRYFDDVEEAMKWFKS